MANVEYFSQRKHALDLLEETGLLGCKPTSTPIDTNLDFWSHDGELFEDTAHQFKNWLVNLFISLLLGQILFLLKGL